MQTVLRFQSKFPKLVLENCSFYFCCFVLFFQFCQQECERGWESKAERREPKEGTAGELDTALAVSDSYRAWQGKAEY